MNSFDILLLRSCGKTTLQAQRILAEYISNTRNISLEEAWKIVYEVWYGGE